MLRPILQLKFILKTLKDEIQAPLHGIAQHTMKVEFSSTKLLAWLRNLHIFNCQQSSFTTQKPAMRHLQFLFAIFDHQPFKVMTFLSLFLVFFFFWVLSFHRCMITVSSKIAKQDSIISQYKSLPVIDKPATDKLISHQDLIMTNEGKELNLKF